MEPSIPSPTAARARPPASRWVVLVDAVGIEDVNEALGRSGGDAVLAAVAAEIETAVGSHGRVARVAGHRWAVLVTGVEQVVVRGAAALAERIVAATGLRCDLGLAAVRDDGPDVARVDAEVALALRRRHPVAASGPLDPAIGDVVRAWRADPTVAAPLPVDVGVRLQRTLVERTIVGAAVVPVVVTPHGPVDAATLHRAAAHLHVPFAVLEAARAGIAASTRPIPPAGVRLWFEVPTRDLVAPGGAERAVRLLSSIGLSGMPRGVVLVGGAGAATADVAAAVAHLQAAGVEIAVDALGDIGLGGLDAWHVDRLVVGPDRVLAAHRGDDGARRALRGLAELAHALGCGIAAVDVPSLEVATTLHDLGIDVAQVGVSEPWAAPRRVRAPAG